MNNYNSITVIIPTYKSSDSLDLCIRSAIAGQQNKNQIIVAVDGTMQLNRSTLNKYKDDIQVLDFANNVGIMTVMNHSAYAAKSDLLLFVNDDNVFPRNWDTILLEDMNKLDNTVLTPNQIEPTNSMFKQFNIINLGRDPVTFDMDKFNEYATAISEDKIDNSGSTFPFIINKLHYIMLGGFDSDFPTKSGYVADWDFFMRCSMAGLTMARTYKLHMYHFVSLTSKSNELLNNSNKEELLCHEYTKYKYGRYIQHDNNTNLKFI